MSISTSPLIRNYVHSVALRRSKNEVNLPHFTIPLLNKMMRVNRFWHDITTHDHIWQNIGDRLGVIFSKHMPNPQKFKVERPDHLFNDKLLSKSMVHLHTQIYPKADQTIITAYYQNHISLPAPSKMAQIIDIYAETTVKAYYGIYSHLDIKEEILPLLGSLKIEDILQLKKINEAKDCLKFRERLAYEIDDETDINITSLETLLAVPEDLSRWCEIHAKALSKIEDLDLQLCYLNTLPDIFGYLPNLKSLELRINNLSQLPDSIGKLTKLRSLCLVGSQLTRLPDSMRNLTNLYYLNLNSNDFSDLPYWIVALKNLNELHIEHNHLTYLPYTIGCLTQLTMLCLEGNKLASLPESIGELKNLKHLNLSDNNLDTIPSTIRYLQKLSSLELDGNKLKLMDLPPEIWSIPNLNHLTIENSWSTSAWEHKNKYQENMRKAHSKHLSEACGGF